MLRLGLTAWCAEGARLRHPASGSRQRWNFVSRGSRCRDRTDRKRAHIQYQYAGIDDASARRRSSRSRRSTLVVAQLDASHFANYRAMQTGGKNVCAAQVCPMSAMDW
jgi:hypothetical protein